MESKKLRVYNKVLLKIKSSHNIALVSHSNPDGDTLGSTTALYELIKNTFPSKQIDLICKDNIPKKFSFISHTGLFKTKFVIEKYDLIIFADLSHIEQSGFDLDKKLVKETYNTISFDHHKTNSIFARQNLVVIPFASTTIILYDIFRKLGLHISKNTATSLLTGIMTDTGGLKHSNVDDFTYKVVAELLELGANHELIIDKCFKNNKLETIKLWGKIIGKSFIDKENIIVGYINKSELDAYGLEYNDVYGIIDYLNMVDGIKYSSMLTQKGDYIKGSLRTLRDDIDLTKVAKKYGGGGHKKASGFTIEGIIHETRNIDF